MIQHAVQPTLRCPLCQDTLRSVALLRTHLTHLHSVTADCTQKLINTVRVINWALGSWPFAKSALDCEIQY